MGGWGGGVGGGGGGGGGEPYERATCRPMPWLIRHYPVGISYEERVY